MIVSMSEDKENANNQNEVVSTEISALDVAKYLIGLAQRDGNPITNLRLQKLLYYAWGNYWHQNREELFADNIEAWPFGPVVRDVYIEYYNELDPKCVLNIEYRAFDEIENKLCENIKNFLERFYEVYKKEDTWDLVDATHRERPWVEAYKENAKEVIDRTTLRNFFENEAF